ncbi:MAG: sigma-70 family RNA polymerase sigma factor [Chloroflexota bacterium]
MTSRAAVYAEDIELEDEPRLVVAPISGASVTDVDVADEIPEMTEGELALADTLAAGEIRGDGGDVTDDPVLVYLREVRPVPLLTSQEEAMLAKAVARGQQAQARLAAAKALPIETMARLEVEVQRGVWARQRLLQANQRLVIGIAKRHLGRGLAFADLIQEGNLGLMRAIDKFDYRRGFRFSTYATWWVRQAMSRAIADHGRSVRVPVHMLEQTSRVVRTAAQLQQRLGRDPGPEEIAAELNLTPAKVSESLRVAQEPISLETPVGEEEDACLSDFIPDESAPEPVEMAMRSSLRDTLGEVMGGLGDRERRVLELRFGLSDGLARTLEETGSAVGVTRERARQIEAEALSKLRHPRNRDRLRDFLN